jgi:hypothetical protein
MLQLEGARAAPSTSRASTGRSSAASAWCGPAPPRPALLPCSAGPSAPPRAARVRVSPLTRPWGTKVARAASPDSPSKLLRGAGAGAGAVGRVLPPGAREGVAGGGVGARGALGERVAGFVQDVGVEARALVGSLRHGAARGARAGAAGDAGTRGDSALLAEVERLREKVAVQHRTIREWEQRWSALQERAKAKRVSRGGGGGVEDTAPA